ncbi:structural maintenance of chromosomes protein 5-like isoform X2 [Oratosquilla oratoria]
MKELNIQVDNLCMFLPQDRVADFAKMNRIQLLENTEKSVVPKDEGPTLLEQHELLKESGKVLSDLESKIEKLSEELESEKRRNANIEDQVKNNDLKKKIEKEIEDLKIRYTWYLYCEKRQEKMASKERKAVMEEQWSVLTKKLKPAENRMEKYRGESNSCREKAKKHENEIKELEPLLDRICQNVEDQEDAIKAAEVELAHHRQQEDQRKREIKDMERHLSVIERELAELEPFDEDALKEKIADLTMQIQNFSQAFTKMRQAMDDDRYQKEALNRKTSGHKKELEELEDVKRRRLEALRQQNQQVFSAVMWLHNNRDKFKGKVYDPMCTVINVLDSGYCKYVEDRISRQDMVAFVCEDKEDMNKFKKFMDQEKLRVNIVHAPHGDPKAFQAKTPIEELQQYGFEKYMSCVMTAPDAVMSYLCKNYNIHRIPVAKSGDFENVPPSVNYFYIDDSRYSKSQSRYDRQWSTSIITVRQPRLLTFSENTERKNDIIRTLEKLRIEMKQIDDKIEKAHAQQKEITQNIEKARDEKKRLVQDREHSDQLKKRVLMKRKQIENRKSKAINMEEKEAEYRKKCEKYTGNAVMKVKEVHKILTKATKGSECSMQCAIKQRLFKERILSLEKEMQ